MKAYLITTGLLFGLMAALHVWRAVAEWPHAGPGAAFILEQILMIALPGALCWWAFLVLRHPSLNRINTPQSQRQTGEQE